MAVQLNGAGSSAYSDLTPPQTANKAAVTDASGVLTTSATTDTELGYVHGVTSPIQTQLSSKETAGAAAAALVVAEAYTDSAVSSEASARSSADSTLSSSITTEATARASADTTLQTNITSEASTRATADTTLQTNITAEASTRAAADTTLQTNIDGKQPLDADLTTIAGLTATTDNFLVAVASAWASRTPSQVRTTLALVGSLTGGGTIATGGFHTYGWSNRFDQRSIIRHEHGRSDDYAYG